MEKSYTMLELKNITKTFKSFNALQNINLQIHNGEFITVLGPSGSGKSTLLNLISGFDNNFAGDIVLDGKNLKTISSNKRNFGMVFQNYSLFPHMTALENVEFPLKIKNKYSSIPAMKIMDRLGLTAQYNNYPSQLSGGQQQRVALARALVYDPTIILLDEPLGALDLLLRNELQTLIKEIHQKTNKTFVYVTHDITEAFYLSDRIVILNDGEVQQIDTPINIYKRPANKFVENFISTGLAHINKLQKILN